MGYRGKDDMHEENLEQMGQLEWVWKHRCTATLGWFDILHLLMNVYTVGLSVFWLDTGFVWCSLKQVVRADVESLKCAIFDKVNTKIENKKFWQKAASRLWRCIENEYATGFGK